MPVDLRWSWCNNNRNKVPNKCNVFESSPNHPHSPIYGKIVFHKIAPWCQKGWGPLLEEPQFWFLLSQSRFACSQHDTNGILGDVVLRVSFFCFFFLSKAFTYFFFYCSGFCHTLKWISHGFTCVPHPDPPSHLPLHPFPLGLPSAPGPSACLMHPTWAGDLFHPR